MITHPSEIVWNDTPLPNVETVPYTCAVLAWMVYNNGKLSAIEIIRPWKNELNPLRWHDDMLPIIVDQVKYWAWIRKS